MNNGSGKKRRRLANGSLRLSLGVKSANLFHRLVRLENFVAVRWDHADSLGIVLAFNLSIAGGFLHLDAVLELSGKREASMKA